MIEGIKHFIAVASGKGGVGKSMVAVNMAVSLSNMGYKVGVLDADIYGPSVPKMLGLSEAKPKVDDKKFIAEEAFGIKTMSIGFLVKEGEPLVWRGPMVQKALFQLLFSTSWGDLDFLIIDMPPGTGDVQLTISQKVPLSGAVIVSTPQDIALIDAEKAIEMFVKVGVPILGLIENMSVFVCPSCNHQSHIFGHDGVKREAEKRKLAFLGEVPLVSDIRHSADNGKPIVSDDINKPVTDSFLSISQNLVHSIETKYKRKIA
jgi:ATP-binding protein involved in chromosome partitioning